MFIIELFSRIGEKNLRGGGGVLPEKLWKIKKNHN
jgi:hypothetical protein